MGAGRPEASGMERAQLVVVDPLVVSLVAEEPESDVPPEVSVVPPLAVPEAVPDVDPAAAPAVDPDVGASPVL
jgi:hypothetical protein